MNTPVNLFKQALKNQRPQIGLWMGLASDYTAEICALAGFDWLVIDGEHSPNNLSSILAQLKTLAAYPGSHAVARVPVGDTALIKQYLDLGAQNILVPMVETAEQARELVRAMRYPPHGVRGVGGGLTRATRWDAVPDYIRMAHEQLCLIVQIESPRGVANATEIAAVEGVDAVFIGPADLSTGMGHAGDAGQGEVQDAIRRTVQATLAAGKACGILAPREEDARRYADWGCRFIAVGIDISLLRQAALANLGRYRDTQATDQAAPASRTY